MERQQSAAWIVECACGYKIREATQDQAASHVQRHAREVHNIEMPREDAKALTRPE